MHFVYHLRQLYRSCAHNFGYPCQIRIEASEARL